MQALFDNEAVVAIVNKDTPRDTDCMHLVRCLEFLTARHDIRLVATHIRVLLNMLAGALSRNSLLKLHARFSHVNEKPSDMHVSLLDLLLVQKPDWESQC